MQIEKTILKHIFDSKDSSLLLSLRPVYFKRKYSKLIYKGLLAYYKKFGNIPPIEMFKEAIKSKVPPEDVELIVGYIDGLNLEKIEHNPKELYEILIEQYSINEIDNNIKELITAAQQRELKTAKVILNNLQQKLNIDSKMPVNIIEQEYTPHKIKLIKPFMQSMRTNKLFLGGVVLIGGTSGGGKSVFTLEQLLYSFDVDNYNVCLLNLELGYDETIARLYANANKEKFENIYGNNSSDIIKKVNTWKNKFFDRKNKFYIENTNLDMHEIENIIRSMHKIGVTVFGLDYIQLVDFTNGKEEWKMIRDLVRMLHRLTQELGIVIITPVQINLTDVKEKDGELKISVRGSKELEFSSTVFLFIYQTKDEANDNMARIFTIKARNSKKSTYVTQTQFNKMHFEDTGVIL